MNTTLSFILGLIIPIVGNLVWVSQAPEAQLGSSMTGTAWFVNSSNQIQAAVSTWGLRVPSLGSASDPCLTVNSTGVFATTTCGSGGSGDNVSVDGGAVVDPNFASTGDIDFVNTSNTVTANINAGAIVNADINAAAAIDYSKLSLTAQILEADLKVVDTASDEDILTYEATTGDFEWHIPSDLITAGTNITWSGSTLNVDDAFLLNTGDVGTGVYDFGGATSFEIPNAANPTVDAVGEIAWETTGHSLRLFGNSTEYVYRPEFPLFGTTFASSSLAYDGGFGASGTTTERRSGYKYAVTVTEIYCETDTGTTLLRVGDGTNWSETLSCSTSGATQASPSNNTFTAREDIHVQIGTSASSPNKIYLDVTGRWTTD